MRVAYAIVLTAGMAGATAAQVLPPAPPRDSPKPKAATAAVSGRVTDRETGKPVRRASIQLFSPDGQNRFETSTDADGRYEFPAVPAGEYYAVASPGEHSASYQSKSFGVEQPSAASFGRPPPLELKSGETRRAVDFALDRTFAIEGRVVNEYGEPMADVLAGVERINPPGGGRSLTTDDRGAFRLYGLGPGEYRLCASAGQRFDDLAHPTSGDVLQTGYPKTCHPATTGNAAARGVTITASDVLGVVIQMQRTRAYTLSGRIVHESGAPVEKASVTVERVEDGILESAPTRVELGHSSFTARGLTPGEYLIRAAVQDPTDAPGMMPRELAYVPVTIDAADVTGVTVMTARGVDLAGRIVFDGDPKPSLRGVRLMITGQRDPETQRLYRNLRMPSAAVKPDLTFDLPRLYGPVIVRPVGLPEEWIVKSVRYGNVDITDVPTEFGHGPESRSVEVIVTNRTATFTARPVDENGQPATNAVVLLVPTDPARWRGGTVAPLLAARKDDTVRFPRRLPGEYFIMAVPAPDVGRVLRSADVLRDLTTRAQRLTLIENENPTIDIRLLNPSGNR